MFSADLETKAYKCAIECVREAMEVAEKIHKDKSLWNEMKKVDDSPVTLADYCVQYVIMKKLRQRFPKIPIVAEEEGRGLTGELLGKIIRVLGPVDIDILYDDDLYMTLPDYYWALDPIDGTRGFLTEGEQYCICLSLLRKRRRSEFFDPIIGVLGCPLLEGGKLLHAYVPDHSDRPSKPVNRETLRVTVPRVNSEKCKPNFNVKEIIPMDSQCKYALLVLNKADVYFRPLSAFPPDYREKTWDHAAGVALLRTNGGDAWDFERKSLKFNFSPFIECTGGIVASRDGIEVSNFIQNTN